jgi:hypothetical protein
VQLPEKQVKLQLFYLLGYRDCFQVELVEKFFLILSFEPSCTTTHPPRIKRGMQTVPGS